jgi:hypothetical protein
MEQILEMLEKQKAIVIKYENNLIKLNVEVFRSVDGYDNYVVSSFGRVKNTKTGRILKAGLSSHGYLTVALSKDGLAKKTYYVHRLVACAFIDNPDNKECVDHKDNNKANNQLTNLRWATTKENSQNSKLSNNNTSNIKGVCFNKRAKKWCARIMIDGIHVFIGYYDNLEDAKTARVNRANEAFGVFVNACEKL